MESVAVVGVIGLVAVGSFTSGSLAATPRTAGPRGSSHGTAYVACAGSLLKLYYKTLGPAFKKATGDNFGGPPCAGSLDLAQEILSNEIDPAAFLAIGAAAIKELFPDGRSRFAMAIASDPLVVAYSKKSADYSELNAIRTGHKPLKALFSLFTKKGFKLGRTDPTQDPQGIFFILMAKLAQKVLHLPSGEGNRALGITNSKPFGSRSQIFSETALPTDIATGIVDAGSEYLPEAAQYGLDYIKLPKKLNFADPAESKLYSTVSLKVSGTVNKGEVIHLSSTLVLPKSGTTFKPANEAAAQAFVAFLLRSKGRSILQSVGYRLIAPVVDLASGVTPKEALPPAIYKLFKSLKGTIGA
jgi:molybdate/tungstate transport system substrate-binding protein